MRKLTTVLLFVWLLIVTLTQAMIIKVQVETIQVMHDIAVDLGAVQQGVYGKR